MKWRGSGKKRRGSVEVLTQARSTASSIRQ